MPMNLSYSFIVPVYNRPDEIRELLESIKQQNYDVPFEVVIIEDGSTETSQACLIEFPTLDIQYFFKDNSGPGDSRNYGMQRAKGNYFIILDSDCLLPPQYLKTIDEELGNNYVDFFGGPDKAHESFSTLQKAIDYSMTSLLTTGGIRGKRAENFQPRSFNMGMAKNAFDATHGFGKIHPGEDPDLTFRLWKQGFKSRLLPDAFVYHKRRISWDKFYKQVHKFGKVRPILNVWHPQSAKITYWFPTLFILGLIGSIGLLVVNFWLPIAIYGIYFLALFLDSWLITKSLMTALLAVYATIIQFLGYGTGFLKSTFFVGWLKRDPKVQFPELFFD